MVRTFLDEAKCPACERLGLEYTAEQIDLPYLGQSLETCIRCEGCGFRHTDFVLTQTKEPKRHLLQVETVDHVSYRVVRSASCTIRIPELGISIEPGAASDAYISNIEGIFVRVERILVQLESDAEDEGSIVAIQAIRDRFDALRNGTGEPVTVILEDPHGNSSILGEGVKEEDIPEDEAAKLKVGMFTFE